MFCPECGALSFPDSKGWIKCPDYKCGYHGPLDNKMKDPVTGEDLRQAVDALIQGKSIPENQIPSMGCNIKWKSGMEPDYFAG